MVWPNLKIWHLIVGLTAFTLILRSLTFTHATHTNLHFIDWVQDYPQGSPKHELASGISCLSENDIRQQGLCFMMQKNLANLEETTNLLLSEYPIHQMMAVHLGYAFRDAGLDENALEIWEQSGAWIHLAYWAIQANESGDEEKAADIIERAVDNILAKPDLNEVEIRYFKSALDILTKVRMEQGSYESAIEAYQARLLLHPTSAFNHRQIGLAFRQLGQYDNAREWLNKARVLAPDDIKIPQELGRVAAAEGDWPAAITYFKETATVKSDPQIQYELGIAYENIGEYVLAQQAFEQAVALSGENKIRYRMALAEVCEQIDCLEISFEQYCLILHQEPDHKKAQEQLLLLKTMQANQPGTINLPAKCP